MVIVGIYKFFSVIGLVLLMEVVVVFIGFLLGGKFLDVIYVYKYVFILVGVEVFIFFLILLLGNFFCIRK